MLSFGFRIFCWYRGICHRTESDLLLFLLVRYRLTGTRCVCEKQTLKQHKGKICYNRTITQVHDNRSSCPTKLSRLNPDVVL